MLKFACCRKPLLLPLSPLLWHHRHHASFPHHTPTQRKWHHNVSIGVGAADPTAPMLTGMLFLTSWGRHRRLAGTLPYVFLCRAQTPVKLPKIMYTQIPFNCSGCSRKVFVDKIHSIFYKNNYPEVPLWVCQRRIVHILLVTGLVTHIWLTILLVMWWAFDTSNL